MGKSDFLASVAFCLGTWRGFGPALFPLSASQAKATSRRPALLGAEGYGRAVASRLGMGRTMPATSEGMDVTGRRDGCFWAGSRPSHDPNWRDVTRRHADQSLTAGRDRHPVLRFGASEEVGGVSGACSASQCGENRARDGGACSLGFVCGPNEHSEVGASFAPLANPAHCSGWKPRILPRSGGVLSYKKTGPVPRRCPSEYVSAHLSSAAASRPDAGRYSKGTTTTPALNPTPTGASGNNATTPADVSANDGRPRFVAALMGAMFLAWSPSAAQADTICHFGSPGTTVSIHPHPDAAAEVRIWNALSFRSRAGPCILTLDGITASVTYNAGPHREPDVFITEPPEGYFAAPDWLLLDDETGATVLIWPMREQMGM